MELHRQPNTARSEAIICGRRLRELAVHRLLAVAAVGHRTRLVLSAIWIAYFALLGQARAETAESALSAAIDGAWRGPQNRARDADMRQTNRSKETGP